MPAKQQFSDNVNNYTIIDFSEGLVAEAAPPLEDGALALYHAKPPRNGWAEGSQALTDARDDGLLIPEFSNEMDAEQVW